MTPFPHYPRRTVRQLDGIWEFRYLGDSVDLATVDTERLEFTERAPVPGCFDTLPRYAGRRGTAVYRRTVEVTPGTPGNLVFDGLGMWARIAVDGTVLAETAMPYSGFAAYVPPTEHATREITIVIDNRFDGQRVPLQEQFFDFYAYGGIYRSVRWHELPPTPLDRVRVVPLDVQTGEIRADIRFLRPTESCPPLEIRVDGQTISATDTLPADGWDASVTLRVPGIRPWTPEDPALHTLAVYTDTDSIVERFGMRTVNTASGDILLNGQPVQLLGYCRHEAHPQFGPALPLQQLVHDLQILRDLGCNFIRGSHYPQDPRFLDLCDEMGFMVWEESLGWGQKPEHFTNPAFQQAQIAQTEAMVRRSINHPAIIVWGFLNEGASQTKESRRLYADLVRTIRDNDSSRPVSYASNHPFDDLNFDLVDILSVNTYPGWYARDRNLVSPLEEIVPHIRDVIESLDSRGFGEKPFLLTEIGAGAIYGWRDTLNAHWSEEYQARYLETVCREVLHNPRIAGVALWQFCDCRTYASSMALGRPRAFNNKGTLDEYRRPKLAYAAVKNALRNTGNTLC